MKQLKAGKVQFSKKLIDPKYTLFRRERDLSAGIQKKTSKLLEDKDFGLEKRTDNRKMPVRQFLERTLFNILADRKVKVRGRRIKALICQRPPVFGKDKKKNYMFRIRNK